MGTRGLVGFVVGGEVKASYNHFDSYPSGTGIEVLHWLREHKDDRGLDERAAAIDLIEDEESAPTPEHLQTAAKYADPSVGGPMTNTEVTTYYQLLRHAQGSLQAYLELGFMVDSRGFADDSLFCEWAYLVNLDDRVLEVYRGFQNEDHRKGRFGRNTDEDWALENEWWRTERQMENPTSRRYPIALLTTYPLDDLPSDEDFVSELQALAYPEDAEV